MFFLEFSWIIYVLGSVLVYQILNKSVALNTNGMLVRKNIKLFKIKKNEINPAWVTFSSFPLIETNISSKVDFPRVSD